MFNASLLFTSYVKNILHGSFNLWYPRCIVSDNAKAGVYLNRTCQTMFEG